MYDKLMLNKTYDDVCVINVIKLDSIYIAFNLDKTIHNPPNL